MPYFSWSGFYVGADAGYGWAKSAGTAENAYGYAQMPYSFDATGAIGGGFIGYNYQTGPFVLGAEADWQAANLSGDQHVRYISTDYTVSTKVEDYGSVRGRLGYSIDRLLVFGTGGYAWGSWKTSYAFTGHTPFHTNEATNSGWTAGGGIEYAITGNLAGRIEYRYTDLGSSSYVSYASNSADTGNRVSISDVRAGISYKFGPSYEPMK